jgi:hypothetical protein
VNVGEFNARILQPGLAELHAIGGPAPSDRATQMLLSIAQQESALAHRAQVLNGTRTPGPARGWWQFERLGGVAGVMRHPASSGFARRLCEHCEVKFDSPHIWRCLEGHDALAVGFARLLLWTDPRPLPSLQAAGWDYYLRNWRPGKPHPQTWARYWQRAGEVIA